MNPCIVLVETRRVIRRAVEMSLAHLGHPVMAVNDANAALELIESRPTILLITASQLPGVDGYSLAHRLKEDPSTGHIPVLMLKERRESRTLSDAEAIAVRNVIEKPFLSQVLVKTVCEILGLSVPDEELYRPYLSQIPLAHPTALEATTSETSAVTPDSVEVPIVTSDETHSDWSEARPEVDVQVMPDESESESAPQLQDTRTPDVLSEDGRTDAVLTEEPQRASESTECEMNDSIDQDDPTVSVAELIETLYTEPQTPIRTDSEVPAADHSGRYIPPHAQAIRFDDDEAPETSDDWSPTETPSVVIAQSPSTVSTPDDAGNSGHLTIETGPTKAQEEPLEHALLERVTATAVDQLAAGQQAAIAELSKDVIESIAWEVIPPLAEAILREEIVRILREERTPLS